MRFWQPGISDIDGSRYESIQVGVHTMMVSGDDAEGWQWAVLDVNFDSVARGEAETAVGAKQAAELAFDTATEFHAWL